MVLPALALPSIARLATSAVRTLAGSLAGAVGNSTAGAIGDAGAGPSEAGIGKLAQGLAGDAKAKATADDFERMFLEQNLDRLFASSGTEGPLGDNGTGGDVYRSMLVKEYAKAVGKTGGIGISDQVYSQLLKLQEGAGHGGGI